MKNGKDEIFRVYVGSTKHEIKKLENDCKHISSLIHLRMSSSDDPRPIINPVEVKIISYNYDQNAEKSDVWVAVNSTRHDAEDARLQLKSMGYVTGSID